jgi:hypothetical protein
MKVWIYKFSGHYLGGTGIVVDETKLKAFNKAVKEIASQGLAEKNKDFTIEKLVELDINKAGADTLDNGDY